MLDGSEQHGGASDINLDDRLNGELLSTFADLKISYQTNRLELAWAALQNLLAHVERNEGLEALIEFSEKAGDMLTSDANDIRDIIDEGFKKNLN